MLDSAPSFENASVDEAPVASAEPAVRRVSVPCNLLGKVLDHGKASAHAVHLLAIKCTKGRGFVLNEKHVAKEYRIGWRAFQRGLAVAKKTGVLDRKQVGRKTYATEKLIEGGRNYVRFNPSLLKSDSRLVAFVLAANISPEPMRPADLAKRFGITSATTISRLVKAAIDGEFVSASTSGRGTDMVARKGYIFELSKNGVTKNGVSKNGATHSVREESTDTERRAQSAEKELAYGTRSSERRPAEGNFEGKVLGPEWILLKDWKSSRFCSEVVLNYDLPSMPALSENLVYWRKLLKWYAPDAPGHLHTPHSCNQALEICSLLKVLTNSSHFNDVLTAFTFWVCRAFKAGKPIRSFSFIFEDLYRRALSDDDTWLYNFPSRMDPDLFDQGAMLANEAMKFLKSHNFPISERRLLSTLQVEELAVMIQRYGINDVRDFMRFGEDNRIGILENESVCGWAWFKENYHEHYKAVASSSTKSRKRGQGGRFATAA